MCHRNDLRRHPLARTGAPSVGCANRKDTLHGQASDSARHLKLGATDNGLCTRPPDRCRHWPEPRGRKIPIGTQLWCVGKQLATIIPGHAGRLASAGFDAVELENAFGKPGAEWRKAPRRGRTSRHAGSTIPSAKCRVTSLRPPSSSTRQSGNPVRGDHPVARAGRLQVGGSPEEDGRRS